MWLAGDSRPLLYSFSHRLLTIYLPSLTLPLPFPLPMCQVSRCGNMLVSARTYFHHLSKSLPLLATRRRFSLIPLPFPVRSCPAGYYQDLMGEADCKECPAGHYCPANTSDYAPNVCPAGYFCPLATPYAIANPCPAGTFGNGTGQHAPDACVPCVPGSYCEGAGNSEPTGLCDPGWYCVNASTEARVSVLRSCGFYNYQYPAPKKVKGFQNLKTPITYTVHFYAFNLISLQVLSAKNYMVSMRL
jgi:hypothetical protein